MAGTPLFLLLINAEGGRRQRERTAGRGKGSWVWSQEIWLLVLIYHVCTLGQAILPRRVLLLHLLILGVLEGKGKMPLREARQQVRHRLRICPELHHPLDL